MGYNNSKIYIPNKTIPLLLLVLFGLIVTSGCKETSKEPFVNDICLPSQLYMLSETQNDIFIEPLMKRWRPCNDVVRFSGTAEYQRRLQGVVSINKPVDGALVKASLINQDDFDTIKVVTSNIVVGEKGKGDKPVTVSVIGDSFTNGAFFKDALLVKGYVPRIKMIGLRDVVGHTGQMDEGRGGWTVNRYFAVTNKRTEPYNGFWQPDGDYKYWGACDFWILANELRQNPEKDWTFAEKYYAGRYETISLKFDTKTGYKKDPGKNDIMFDNALNSYVKYDGRMWLAVEYDHFNWDFNYGKYLAMWNLEAPTILAELLGLNDFRNAADPLNIDFTQWNAQMEKIITSYFKAVPSGKFVIMIPSSSNGILDNQNGEFTTRQNACMWEVRKNIIEKFDWRTNEDIYIVDAGISIDNLYGTNFLTDSVYTLPYAVYVG